ncbi:hypothetical protein N0V90_010418 [Kalmusia sp. IMI 367209]|nr:hypothetical protein N0V90_010418 [Kalmusia sp. IMI 367209]
MLQTHDAGWFEREGLASAIKIAQKHGMHVDVPRRKREVSSFVEDCQAVLAQIDSTDGLDAHSIEHRNLDGLKSKAPLSGREGRAWLNIILPRTIGRLSRRNFWCIGDVLGLGIETAFKVKSGVIGLWVRSWIPRKWFTGPRGPRPDTDRMCSICRLTSEETSMEMVATKVCRHVFCGDYLDIWCNTESGNPCTTCPMCRRTLSEKTHTVVEVYKRVKDEDKEPENYWAYDEIDFWKRITQGYEAESEYLDQESEPGPEFYMLQD